MEHKDHQGTKFENFIFGILKVPAKSILVMVLIFAALAGSIMMLPTKISLALL